ncbi:HlyD family efflux transporter periplasmic adaptor subunit [Arcobacter sp. HD9-500m-PIT-SAG03]|nr:HlyD family efflux transporter periplasmic adaptor subunit [Arcobacter sp. HD9-500m-PIT-SAG03]
MLELSNELAYKASKDGFAFEKIRKKHNKLSNPMAVCFNLELKENSSFIIFFTYDYTNQDDLNNTILKTQLLNDILQENLNLNKTESIVTSNEDDKNIKYILNLISELLEKKEFRLTSNILVNDLASKFDLDRVSFGIYKGNKLKIISVSHIDNFDKKHLAYEDMLDLFEESSLQDEDIVLQGSFDSEFVIDEHQRYYKENNLKTIITFPIRYKEKIIGVINGYSKTKFFEESEIILLRLTINKIAPVLKNVYENDVSIFGYFKSKLKTNLEWWFTPQSALLKLILISIISVIFYMSFFTWRYDVEATSVLVTDEETFISSPFDGVIKDIFVKAGDEVSANQKLFTLDIEELKLKQMESKADIMRFQKEKEKYMAKRELADMAISNAKVNQANSRLERIEYNINNATIRTSIKGTIVKGDKEKLLGSPINKGDVIFQISNSNKLYLEIKVPENEIYHIKKGQKGQIILLSDPLNQYEFTVTNIIPKAEVSSSDGNIYIVYGNLDVQKQNWWHPGMNGMVKIDAGEKNFFWILTHNLFDFLRIYLW